MISVLPSWCTPLERKLSEMAADLTLLLSPSQPHGPVLTPESFGMTDCMDATHAIQSAIDEASHSHGIVRLTAPVYRTGALVLRSNVCIEIAEGTLLLGSTVLEDYPEHHASRLTVQDTSMGMHQSLFYAEGCEHIALVGKGTIDMQGTPDHFPGDETAQGTPGRPFMIRMIDCSDVHIEGLTFRNSACWMQNYLHCDHLLIENLTVRNHANYNNDGLDLDGCTDVIVRRCNIHSGDDALCFKGASLRPCERVLIEDCELFSACNALKIGTDTQGDFRHILVRRCIVGGLEDDPSGLKHPYADSGISLEMVDGGTVEEIVLEDLTITRAWSPLFMRLDDRGRVRPGDPKPSPGNLRKIYLTRFRGHDNGPRGSYFLGYESKPIEDVVLHDIELDQTAWTQNGLFEEPPELHLVYPDAHMIDPFGPSPASALYARHVQRLTLSEYRIVTTAEETRPTLLIRP